MSDPRYTPSPFGQRPASDQGQRTLYGNSSEPASYPVRDGTRGKKRIVGGPVMSSRRQARIQNAKIRRNILIGISVIAGILLALIASDTLKLGTGPQPALAEEVSMVKPAKASPADVAGIEKVSLRTPTANDPLRTYIAGDSLAGSFGLELATKLGETGVVKATYDSRPSSGLVNQDFFDWEKHSRTMMSQYNPEVIIFMIGTNDASIVRAEPDNYEKKYSELLNDLVDIFNEEKRSIYFVLPPAMKDSALNKNLAKLNDVIERVASQRNLNIIDSSESLSPNSKFTTTLKVANKTQTVRAGDGIHLSNIGGKLLAEQIYDELRDRLNYSTVNTNEMIPPTKVAGCCSQQTQSRVSTTSNRPQATR